MRACVRACWKKLRPKKDPNQNKNKSQNSKNGAARGSLAGVVWRRRGPGRSVGWLVRGRAVGGGGGRSPGGGGMRPFLQAGRGRPLLSLFSQTLGLLFCLLAKLRARSVRGGHGGRESPKQIIKKRDERRIGGPGWKTHLPFPLLPLSSFWVCGVACALFSPRYMCVRAKMRNGAFVCVPCGWAWRFLS